MPVYFAYGANMDRHAMKQRCPSSRPIGLGRLVEHRFFVSRDGYGSIKAHRGSAVFGLAWDLALKDIAALDRFESVDTGLYCKRIMPVRIEGKIWRALVYVGRNAEPGLPVQGYMESVLTAAEACGIPPSHMRDLRLWLPNSRNASTRRA